MARDRGWIKTPESVVALVKRARAEKCQSPVAKNPVLALLAERRYLKGRGEPSRATLESFAAYLGVSVAWLRDYFLAGKHEGMDFNLNEPTALCAKCGEELQASPVGFVQIISDGTEIEGDGILRLWPCSRCCKE